MKLEAIGTVELVYTEVDQEVPQGDGAQVYGIMTGALKLEGLEGKLHLTNLARRRPDGTFTPTLRGTLTTPEGVRLFLTMDGLSVKDPHPGATRRLVTTAVTVWSTDPRYRAWNEVLLLAEMEGGKVGESWGVHGPVHRCVPQI